jgi:ABC-type branched-subunit amino acid transport system ATPase component/branched-subunit amino acid ABC-type transport system permease component
MEEVLRFALIGLGLGAMYALASQGLVLIYRGSGVLNFAQGAVGMLGAFVYYEARVTFELPFLVAAFIGIIASGIVGILVQIVVMRRLKNASPLARIVATLGLLLTLQSVAVLKYGGRTTFVAPELPQTVIPIYGTIALPLDRLIMVIVAIILTFILWSVYKYSRFGLGTSAVAENELAASTLGWSSDRIAMINWAVGSALAGLAAILVSPIITLQVSVMTNLVLAAMAAALIAGFRSFPIALVAGLTIGMVQTAVGRFSAGIPGLADSLPLVAIVIILLVRGKSLPLRDYIFQKLPLVGSGRIRWKIIAPVLIVFSILIISVPPRWQDALTITIGAAMIVLSIVLLTGYAGQISLAQFAMAGFGAFVAGRMVSIWDVPFLVALICGILATVPLGILVALPAVRTRGITLAVVTLGLGTTLEFMVFNSDFLTGGFFGTQIGQPDIFGLNISAIVHPERYALVALALLMVMTVVVGNIRRGRSGRKLIAVRTNERAAAALGISITSAKLYAFGVAAGIAACGGIILAFRSETVVFGNTFSSFNSISAVGWAMIGGIGFLLGPLFGATLAPGSIGAALLNAIPGEFSTFLPLVSGLLIVFFVIQNQNGIAKEMSGQFKALLPKLARDPKAHVSKELMIPNSVPVRVAAKILEVKNLTVRYGGTVAVEGVDLTVRPGQVLGLIGPNGAGKTSIIDAITGFAPQTEGDVILDGTLMNALSPMRRARAGVSRSFQSLELFEDCTVLDNLLTAADPFEAKSYFLEIFRPSKPRLSPATIDAIREFDLAEDLDTVVENLPYGKRRLVALARAVAIEPSVLLLDEPAAGLGDVESAELADMVRKLAKNWGIGVLLVEHDMNFVMGLCDEIVVVDFGKKIAEGTPAEVRGNALVLEAYLGAPTTVENTEGMTR